jgi:TldD protein
VTQLRGAATTLAHDQSARPQGGRAAPGQAPRSSIGNLILQPSQSLSPAELKKKLLEICHDENKPYGYYVKTLSLSQAGPARGAGATQPRLYPVLLYRVNVQDGHEELVRGAIFSDELDARSLRNDLVAAGNDPLVSNRATGIPTTVISPSILFDELEVRRTSEQSGKPPEHTAPELTSSSSR